MMANRANINATKITTSKARIFHDLRSSPNSPMDEQNIRRTPTTNTAAAVPTAAASLAVSSQPPRTMNRKLETNTAAFETYSSGRMNWLMISPIFPMANYELGRRFNGSGGHFSAAARSDTG